MYIGIYDYDLISAKMYKYIPNLDLMKISSWHKSQKDIVEFSLDCRSYRQYSKIYLAKNRLDNIYPDLLLSEARDKIQYLGDAFTNGIYQPLPKEIQKVAPDLYLYGNYSKRATYQIQYHQNSILRLSDGDSGFKKFNYIYDYNPIQFLEVFKEDIKKYDSHYFWFYYPFICDNIEKSIEIAQIPNFSKKTIQVAPWTNRTELTKYRMYTLERPIYIDLFGQYNLRNREEKEIAIIKELSNLNFINNLENFKVFPNFKDTLFDNVIRFLNKDISKKEINLKLLQKYRGVYEVINARREI